MSTTGGAARLLEGQVAVVTGASRGIGAAVAALLAEHGCDVAVNYRQNEASACQVAEVVRSAGRRALVVQADVAEPEQARALMERARDELGEIQILVNNAGIVADGLLLSQEPAELAALIHTNLLGPIHCTRAVAMQMMRRRRGRIINISSSAASKPGRGQSGYAAAKGGLEAFTRAMAVELAPKNILVNAVAPGVIETEMTEQIRRLATGEIMNRLLLKRFGSARDVAEAVLFLAGPQSAYITGQVFHLDGGLKMA